MFPDLADKGIQPQKIDVNNLPEIELPENLGKEIQTLLEEEEEGFARVYNKTAVVQTDRNYVFFSYHWLYLAVLCKRYAEALKPYGDFFDKKIRGNHKLLEAFKEKKCDSAVIAELLPDLTDRERMMKYIIADAGFRPGKSLINNDGKVRSIKDIFGSCVLKKISVPDASSNYLGNLVYYLTKRPALFNAIEIEVRDQMGNVSGALKLPSAVKVCAKAIIDCIYEMDGFARINAFFKINDKSIKIDSANLRSFLPGGNFLRYVFALPESGVYNPDGYNKSRVFDDREYDITIEGKKLQCRLSTEWKGTEPDINGDGNFLKALIVLVNECYDGLIEITDQWGEYYLHKGGFKLRQLPDIFRTDYSRRFITSLLAKPFVILTGNSGTGKTRIARQFAEYLEKETGEGNKNWLLVPVGADWTDNAKILGFYNPLANNGKGKYEKTGIIRLIEQANIYKNIPFFIILDEMNLSHVERYFSDFLSHMEIPNSLFELDGYEGTLVFSDNIFVIGTVNIDETTYMFSPKVLDRSNVVEFRPEKQDVLALFGTPVCTEQVRSANNGMAEAFLKLAKEIRSGQCNIEEEESEESEQDNKKVMDDVRVMFERVYEVVEEQGFEFAYRTVREIRQYIAASYELADKDFCLSRAIDEQLLQKVLPKIHGNNKQIGKLLDELEKICQQSEMKLELSAKKIEQMKGKLAQVQYASFI